MYDNEDLHSDSNTPVVFTRRQSNEVHAKQIRALAFHAAVFVYWLIASHLLVDLFLILGAAMWAVGAISAQVIPNEREGIIRNTHRFIIAFSSLIGYKLLLVVLSSIPGSEWSRALGIQIGEAFTLTATNYLSTMFLIFAIGIPVSFVVAMGVSFFTFRSGVDVRERTEQVIRTGTQRTVQDRREARRR